MTAISIIVPIYNMQHLMRRCVDSLLSQAFTDYELLLVDDGSTDDSPAICDEYADQDARVRAYHKSNGGLSDARNYGLQRATGKYSIFADPDDYVDAKGLDALYAEAERTGADMTLCDLYREDEYSRHYMRQRPSSLDHETVLRELFLHVGGFTVNKLIRTYLYAEYDIRFPLGIYGCEDQYTMARLLLHDISIAYAPVAFYHYMYNPASLTRHYDEKTYEMDVHVVDMFSSLLQGNPAWALAVNGKREAVFGRAFWNGGHYYSSAEFSRRFHDYSGMVKDMGDPALVRGCMYLSCHFGYRFFHRLVFLLFAVKRMAKQVKHSINKKK